MVHLLNTGSLYQKNNYERAITQKQNSNGTISVLSCIAENWHQYHWSAVDGDI